MFTQNQPTIQHNPKVLEKLVATTGSNERGQILQNIIRCQALHILSAVNTFLCLQYIDTDIDTHTDIDIHVDRQTDR